MSLGRPVSAAVSRTVLLVCQPGVAGGILDLTGGDDLVFALDLGEAASGGTGGEAFANWSAAVRERARAE